MVLFFSFISAMFITMLLIPPLMRSAHQLQIIDVPDARKVHSGAIPRIGGIAMVVGALLPILVWITPQNDMVSFIIGMAVIFAFGIWDDRNDLDYRLKFLGQIIAVLVVMFFGGVIITTVPMMDGHPLPGYIALPLTLIFLLGITNAINLSDGLDGLAGGTTMLSLGVISLLAYQEDDLQIMLISIAILGSILGFLRFNTHPARVFMGDGGSQFLGFSIGVLSIMLTQRDDAPLSTALPLLILGLPILDTVMVMVQRIREGRSPFSPDKNHIHHKLLALGFSHYEAVFSIYVAQASLVLAAYGLRFEEDATVLLVFLLFCLCVISFFRFASFTGWRLRQVKTKHGPSVVSRTFGWINAGTEGKVTYWAAHMATTMLIVYLASVVLIVDDVSMDIGILAAILCLGQCIRMMNVKDHSFTWLERSGFYILTAIVCYLSSAGALAASSYLFFDLAFFMVLAVAVVIGFRFSLDRAFKVTTLDFLVIFAAFAVPNLPGQILTVNSVGELIARLIVIFYAIELILTQGCSAWRRRAIRITTIVAAGWLSLRGFGVL